MSLNFFKAANILKSVVDWWFKLQTFTEAILGARSTAVPLVRLNRYHFALTTQIRSIIAQKNGCRRALQRHHNTDDRDEYEVLNNIFWDMCGGLSDISFGNKLRDLRVGHRSFWSFTRIIKNKFRGIPALKLDGLTLITESEKANAIASKLFLAHDNTFRSELYTSVRDSNAFSIAMHLIMIHLHARLLERLGT
jgi:hypothetical protein